MAGVKGRSGGKRPGAGRKPAKKPAAAEAPARSDAAGAPVPDDPLQFLTAVMAGKIMATALQVRAAIAAAQYVHTKRHDGGKKDDQIGRAKKVAGGKFAAAAPPLKLVGTK